MDVRPKLSVFLYMPLVAVVLGIGGKVAEAAPLCTAVVTNAANFQALGNGGCQFGDKMFFGFTYSYALEDSSGNLLPSNVPATAVSVQFSNLGGLSFQPVISFIANWDVINGGQGDVRITYNVSSPLTAAMFASSLTLSGFVSNIDPDNQFNSLISGAESVTPNGGATVALGVELDPPLTPSGLVFRRVFDQSVYPSSTQISISKDIFLSAGSDSGVPGGPPNGNEATLTRIDQGITEHTSAPEPVTSFLFGSGLLSMVLFTKRRGKLKQ